MGEPVRTLNTLPPSIEKLVADQENNLFLLSPAKAKLHKVFSANNYDSTLTIGGKGIRNESFNLPSQLVVPNRQSVFVLDYLNRRIVHLNTNLKQINATNFLTLQGQIPETEYVDLYPFAFSVGPTGELFLFNRDDLKIYKFTNNGRLERTFAGLDYGAGSVVAPCNMAMDDRNNVYAIDCEDQSLRIYDLYGTYQYRLEVPMPFMWENALVMGNTVVFFNANNLFFYNTFTKKAGPHLQTEDDVLDLAVNREYLFVLYEDKIDLHKLGK